MYYNITFFQIVNTLSFEFYDNWHQTIFFLSIVQFKWNQPIRNQITPKSDVITDDTVDIEYKDIYFSINNKMLQHDELLFNF